MYQYDLVSYLKKQGRNRRIIYFLIIVALFVFAEILTTKYKASKVVKVSYFLGEPIYTTVTYNEELIPGLFFSWFGFIVLSITFLFDLAFSSIKTEEVQGSVITIYNRLFYTKLYIDRECQDILIFRRKYLEGRLKNGTIVTATKGMFNSYHLSFSKPHQTKDI